MVSAFIFFRFADRGDEIDIISLTRFIEGVLSFDSCGGFHCVRVCAWRGNDISIDLRVHGRASSRRSSSREGEMASSSCSRVFLSAVSKLNYEDWRASRQATGRPTSNLFWIGPIPTYFFHQNYLSSVSSTPLLDVVSTQRGTWQCESESWLSALKDLGKLVSHAELDCPGYYSWLFVRSPGDLDGVLLHVDEWPNVSVKVRVFVVEIIRLWGLYHRVHS